MSLSPSSSSASPNSISLKSQMSSNSSNSLSVSANKNKLEATKELENLMASLTMYKVNDKCDNQIPLFIHEDENLKRTQTLKNVCHACEGTINGQVGNLNNVAHLMTQLIVFQIRSLQQWDICGIRIISFVRIAAAVLARPYSTKRITSLIVNEIICNYSRQNAQNAPGLFWTLVIYLFYSNIKLLIEISKSFLISKYLLG